MSELQVHRFPKVYQIPEDVSPAYREFYLKEDVDKLIEDLKAGHYADSVDSGMRERRLELALWLMTAEWADAMGLASCNIAIKLSVKERFFYHDEAIREKDIKKYRHRQVVFYKYADYCRAKAEEYK